MLPLWIIDLRGKTDRRDEFERLVGQIDHVLMPKPSDPDPRSIPKDDDQDGDLAHGISSEETPIIAVNQDVRILQEERKFTDAPQKVRDIKLTDEMSVSDRLDVIDQQEADRNSRIVGNYWKYSLLADKYYEINIKSDEEYESEAKKVGNDTQRMAQVRLETAKKTAEKLYKFQSDLVTEGQAFIKELRKSNARPDLKINIVVLGDLTEDFTRIVFPAIAAIIQKEKERLLPHHIHQGMEVIGMLYVPSDINTRKPNLRKSMQRTLNEIDVQHQVTSIRGYDHMMLYQDVQNRTECSYTIMNNRQLAEYLLQCLVHLYLACNETHPLLSGTSSADVFYFSMGATSVFFDTDNEDAKKTHEIAVEFIRNFKCDGTAEKPNEKLSIIGEDEYMPKSFFNHEAMGQLEADVDMDTPSPHPIRNFLYKYLKRYYYGFYLRFFTKHLMQRIVSSIDTSTRSALETIASENKKKFDEAQSHIFENLRNLIGQLSANDGGLPTIISLFKRMQEQLSRNKNDIQSVLEHEYWNGVEETYLNRSIKDSFIEYHNTYTADIKGKTGDAGQIEVKKQAVTTLNGILSNEATMLSRIGRSLLLGILSALAIVPLLNLISPQFVNLGPVRLFSEPWSIFLFFIPALFQLVSYYRYTRKKKNAVNKLKAMYLHDAYARVANRIESEINNFYDRMIALGDKYIARCESIRNEVGRELDEADQVRPLFPVTMFNQPLILGSFGGDILLPENEADDSEVRINYTRYKLREIGKVEYFMLINQHKGILLNLFRDVKLCENLIRRVNSFGDEELVTKEQQEQELQEKWNEHCTEFYKQLREMSKETLIPRENATVGEKLRSFCVSSQRVDVLKPMIAYAATNGEMTSSADKEFTDAKLNDKRVEKYILPLVSSASHQMQIDKHNTVYRKYIFITRWRCFEHFNFNRILPTEDFDEKIRNERVAGVKQKKIEYATQYDALNQTKTKKKLGAVYKPRTSSLLLWALCPDDSSSLWFRLFDSDFFVEAYHDKNIYREILNVYD